MFPFHCVHCVENVHPLTPSNLHPSTPRTTTTTTTIKTASHTGRWKKKVRHGKNLTVEILCCRLYFFFYLCTSICCMWRTGNAAISGFRKCCKWSEVLLQEVLFNLLCLGGGHFIMSAKFRLLFFVVSTSGCLLWFGCMGTSPPSLWVTYAEIAGAPFIPVYNAKLAINTGLVGALMVIDPGFVGQQKL